MKRRQSPAQWKYAGHHADIAYHLKTVTVRNPSGRGYTDMTVMEPYPHARIHVRNSDLTWATLWTSERKTAATNNGVLADRFGNYSFYVDPGHYIVGCEGVWVPCTVLPDPLEPRWYR